MLYQVSQKNYTRLDGCGIKSMRPIFKTEMLIYHQNAKFEEKFRFARSLII